MEWDSSNGVHSFYLTLSRLDSPDIFIFTSVEVKIIEFFETLKVIDDYCILIDFVLYWLFHSISLFFDILCEILSFFVGKAWYWDFFTALSDDTLLFELKERDKEEDCETVE